MTNKYAENWQEYNKSVLEAAKELETINTHIVEKLSAKQLELANALLDTGTKSVKTIVEFKAPQDIVAEQTKLSREFNEKLIESARATADIISESREAYRAWMEKGMKAMTLNVELLVPNFATEKTAEQKAA